MSILQTKCPVCTGTGWQLSSVGTEQCPHCEGRGMVNAAMPERTEPMTDLKKTIRKSTTVTTTVEFDSDTVEKILAQAAGAPERGWSVEISEYGYTATVTWTTTESSEEPGQ